MAGHTANINIRVSKDLKMKAESLFEDLGINVSTAINMFLTQSVRNQSIPFEITKNVPNKETLNALNEAMYIAEDSNVESYSSVKKLFEDLK